MNGRVTATLLVSVIRVALFDIQYSYIYNGGIIICQVKYVKGNMRSAKPYH